MIKLAALFLLAAPTLVLALSMQSSAQEKPARLYRIREHDKYGFIDRAGNVIVPATLAGAEEFSEGLACVRKTDRFGFIDASGSFAIEPIFSRAYSFSDGLALVIAAGGKRNSGVWGYIDKTGKLVITLQDYEYPSFEPQSFTEGLAVYPRGNKWGYIDKTGRIAIEPQFDWAFAFSEGRAKVRVGELCGFIDRLGNMVIKLQFPRPTTPDILLRPVPTDHDLGFHDGLAAIEMGSGQNWAYIDQTGTVAFLPPAGRYSPFSFSEGLVRMINEHGNEGFLDTKGNIAIEPVWQFVRDFSEGLAAAEKRNNYQGGCENHACWGYIDKTGQYVIGPRFASAEPFRGGLAWVSLAIPRKNYSESYHQGYIDRTGKFVWSTMVR